MVPLKISFRLLAALAAAACLLGARDAEAHPHVFVVAKETVVFAPDGAIRGVRAAWTFDDMYSAFLVQGLGAPDEIIADDKLAPLARTNVESLNEFGYFTVVKAGGHQLDFDSPIDYGLHEGSDKLLTLSFTLPLKSAASARQAFSLSVYDPTYFVSFELDDKDPVSLDGAPKGCSATVMKPKPLEVSDNKKLSEAFFTNMSPGIDFGIKLASRAIVACP